MVKAILHGCNGKMGQVIQGICAEDNGIEIVAGIDVFQGIQHPYPVFQTIADCETAADVIIDFSNAGAIDALLDYSMKKKLPVVLCTTGLSEAQLEKVKQTAAQTAVLKSANMSLGINTLMDLLKKAVSVLSPAGFDIEIVEKHHNQKLDAPSGTALALADTMNETLKKETDMSYDYRYDRSTERKKREKNESGIVSVRGGNIVGEHEVIFAGTDEVITLKHTAHSKAVFAKGAVEAAKFLAGKAAGMYDMSDVIAASGA